MGKSNEQFIAQREFEASQEENSEYYNLIGSIFDNEITLSYSSLKQFYNTPQSFVKYKLKKFEKTPSMIFGSLLDCLILTPENFDKQFCILDSVPKTDNQLGFVKDYLDGKSIEDAFNKNYKRGDAQKTFESLSEYIDALKLGKDIISSSDKEKAEQIKESVLKNPTAQSFLEQAVTVQEKLEWEHKGFKCQGFLDVRGENFIMDLKYKGQSSDVNEFQWDFKKLHYDLQAGMYCKAATLLGFCENPKYYIMVYDAQGEVSVIEIEQSYIAYGQHKYEYILQEFKRCTSENLWNLSHDFYAQNKGVYSLIKPNYASIKGVLK